jgi:hypothetical protein
MVLTIPGPTELRHAESSGGASKTPDQTPDQEVLGQLRNGAGLRPRFDAGLAGGMRAWLEDAASELAAARGGSGPLYLGSKLLSPPSDGSPDKIDGHSTEIVTAVLVRALFRQLVLTGAISDPLTDALGALRVEPGREALLRHVDTLPAADRSALASTLAVHAANLSRLTPRFAPGWLPRTGDRVAIPLAGGRVILTGVFDLLVGAPETGVASVCALGLCTGDAWAQARTSLHFLSLLETLRHGIPPFRVALLHSATGRYGVEDVREEHVKGITGQLAQRMSEMARTND